MLLQNKKNCALSWWSVQVYTMMHGQQTFKLELRIMYTWAEEPIQVTKRRERSDLFNSSKVKCGLDRIDLSFGKVGSNFSYTSFIIQRIKMSHVHRVSARHVVCCTPFPQTWLLYVCTSASQKFHKWPQNRYYNKHKKVVFRRKTKFLCCMPVYRADPSGRAVLRCGSAAARLLGLWVQIPPGSWTSVSCECCMLKSRGLREHDRYISIAVSTTWVTRCT
jgi:hypothetical protein